MSETILDAEKSIDCDLLSEKDFIPIDGELLDGEEIFLPLSGSSQCNNTEVVKSNLSESSSENILRDLWSGIYPILQPLLSINNDQYVHKATELTDSMDSSLSDTHVNHTEKLVDAMTIKPILLHTRRYSAKRDEPAKHSVESWVISNSAKVHNTNSRPLTNLRTNAKLIPIKTAETIPKIMTLNNQKQQLNQNNLKRLPPIRMAENDVDTKEAHRHICFDPKTASEQKDVFAIERPFSARYKQIYFNQKTKHPLTNRPTTAHDSLKRIPLEIWQAFSKPSRLNLRSLHILDEKPATLDQKSISDEKPALLLNHKSNIYY